MTNQTNAENINGEIETMKNLQDNNIVRMFEVYQTKNNIYLILEYCN